MDWVDLPQGQVQVETSDGCSNEPSGLITGGSLDWLRAVRLSVEGSIPYSD
jgi:hypothetical protein